MVYLFVLIFPLFAAFHREKQLTKDHCSFFLVLRAVCSKTQKKYKLKHIGKQLFCKPFCLVFFFNDFPRAQMNEKWD